MEQEAPPRLQQRPPGPVIPAADLGLWFDAAAALTLAHTDAQAIRVDARAAYEAEKVRGHAEGVRAGAADIAHHLAQLLARKDAAIAGIEAALPALVGEVLERVLGQADRGEMLGEAVRHALSQQRWSGRAVLRVCPEDQKFASYALASDPRMASIHIEPSATLAPGACFFETDQGSIELSLDIQLAALRDGIARGWDEEAAA